MWMSCNKAKIAWRSRSLFARMTAVIPADWGPNNCDPIRSGRQGGDSIEQNFAWVLAWKWLEIPFWFWDMYKLPIFGHFLSAGNCKPKLKWFLKPKLKPNFSYWIGPQGPRKKEGRKAERIHIRRQSELSETKRSAMALVGLLKFQLCDYQFHCKTSCFGTRVQRAQKEK